MEGALQISYKDIPKTEAIDNAIRDRIDKLEHYFDRLTSCRVVVEKPHQHHKKGNHYCIHIDLTLPNYEIVVRRDPTLKGQGDDIYVAIRDGFDIAERKLKNYVDRLKREVKHHEEQPTGQVIKIFPEQGYGFLLTSDGREIYFDENCVLNASFNRLSVGAKVRFTEEMGDEGPQASTIHLIH